MNCINKKWSSLGTTAYNIIHKSLWSDGQLSDQVEWGRMGHAVSFNSIKQWLSNFFPSLFQQSTSLFCSFYSCGWVVEFHIGQLCISVWALDACTRVDSNRGPCHRSALMFYKNIIFNENIQLNPECRSLDRKFHAPPI